MVSRESHIVYRAVGFEQSPGEHFYSTKRTAICVRLLYFTHNFISRLEERDGIGKACLQMRSFKGKGKVIPVLN
jgi:hypothetical protein